jgi:Ribbon-helix-helix protein, copG family
MNRTQVYLTDDIVRGVRTLARKLKLPEAKIIRDLLSAALQQHRDDDNKASSLIGKYSSGRTDTSRNVDAVVYGRK